MGWGACRRRSLLGWSPWISLALGPRPGRVTHCCFEHAGQTFGSRPRPPGIPSCYCRTVGEKRGDAEPEEIARRGARAGDRAGVRDRCGQGLGHGVYAAAAPSRRAGGSAGCGRCAATTGAIIELADHLVGLGIEKVTVGVDLGLLADLVLPVGGRGLRRAAGQRPRCEERAGPAQDGQARCGVAGQAHREGPVAARRSCRPRRFGSCATTPDCGWT